MSQETIVVLQMIVASVVAGVTFYFMQQAQRKKEDDANAQYEFTLKMIEMRNKKHGDGKD